MTNSDELGTSLRAVAEKAETHGTIRQRRKVRKLMSEQTIPLLLHVSGGEFLELQDHAKALDLTTEAYVERVLRTTWEATTGKPLGFAYEVKPASDEAISLGARFKQLLGLETR